MAFCDIVKGWPDIHTVDRALPAADGVTVEEGMIVHEVSGEWLLGCPQGRVPYITGPAQSSTALDVQRNVVDVFGGFPGGFGEAGPNAVGCISLNNPIVFQTDQFTGDPTGKVVYADVNGQVAEVTAGNQQIIGYCRSMQQVPDEYNRTVVEVEASVVLQAAP